MSTWRRIFGIILWANDGKLSADDNAMSKILDRAVCAAPRRPLRREAGNVVADFTARDVEKVLAIATTAEDSKRALIVWIAWRLGQRIKDVMRIVVESVDLMSAEALNAEFDAIAITITMGKRVGRGTKPYVIWLPTALKEADLFMHQVRHPAGTLQAAIPAIGLATAADLVTPVFVKSLDEEFLEREVQVIGRMIKRATNLNVLDVRRGGLQTLALAGASVETLLTYSRHKKRETLLEYLHWGKWYPQVAKSAAELLQRVEQVQFQTRTMPTMNRTPILTTAL